MEESNDRFIARDDGAEQNGENDGNAREIFNAAIAVSETLAGFPARQPEGDPQRNGGCGVADIVDRVGEKRHASGKQDNDNLKKGGYKQPDERPFDGPDTPLRGINRWIDSSVLVCMTSLTMIVFIAMVVLMIMLMFGHKY